jgi:hypothetical protein
MTRGEVTRRPTQRSQLTDHWRRDKTRMTSPTRPNAGHGSLSTARSTAPSGGSMATTGTGAGTTVAPLLGSYAAEGN